MNTQVRQTSLAGVRRVSTNASGEAAPSPSATRQRPAGNASPNLVPALIADRPIYSTTSRRALGLALALAWSALMLLPWIFMRPSVRAGGASEPRNPLVWLKLSQPGKAPPPVVRPNPEHVPPKASASRRSVVRPAPPHVEGPAFESPPSIVQVPSVVSAASAASGPALRLDITAAIRHANETPSLASRAADQLDLGAGSTAERVSRSVNRAAKPDCLAAAPEENAPITAALRLLYQAARGRCAGQ